MSINSITNSGFASYSLNQSFHAMQTKEKIKRIAVLILFVGLAIASFVVAHPLAIIAGVLLTIAALRAALVAKGVWNRYPPTQNLFSTETLQRITPLSTRCDGQYDGFATLDGKETHAWRLKLIREAKRSIVYSASYMGGSALREMLTVIEEELAKKEALTVALSGSSPFLTGENRQQLRAIQERFGERFIFIESPDKQLYHSPATQRLSLVTNHVRALVIDGGNYFMTGGSGVTPQWSEETGLTTPEGSHTKGRISRMIGIKGYRDADFIFHSPHERGIGTRLHVETLKLMSRYGTLPACHLQCESTPSQFNPGWAEELGERLARDLALTLYATGPDTQNNPYFADLTAAIARAQSSVFLAQMHFDPPRRLTEALEQQIAQGHSVTLLTNTAKSKVSPVVHHLYAPRAARRWTALFHGQSNPNIKIHLFDKPAGVTMHKKVTIVDESTTFVGTSNWGKISEKYDYEVNLRVQSKAFARTVTATLQPDIELSTRIQDKDAFRLSWKDRLKSVFIRYVLKPLHLIG
ncbi:MAG: hypothetical protein RL235_993 [Chlamydiota bacterium]|jgi:hypothetical protein